jgi:hypothetical protein
VRLVRVKDEPAQPGKAIVALHAPRQCSLQIAIPGAFSLQSLMVITSVRILQHIKHLSQVR